MKKKPETFKIIHEDHPVVEMLVDDMIARQERLAAGTFTVRDVQQDDRDPPFVFLLNTHDIDNRAPSRR